jgi:hypothetical protein
MRRLFILGLALSLLFMGAGPLSACALLTSKVADCAAPETQSRCDHMNMDDSATRIVAAPDKSCCSASQAPVPDSQDKVSGLSVAALVAAPELLAAAPRVQQLQPVLPFLQNLSPPPLQSALCTFLI